MKFGALSCLPLCGCSLINGLFGDPASTTDGSIGNDSPNDGGSEVTVVGLSEPYPNVGVVRVINAIGGPALDIVYQGTSGKLVVMEGNGSGGFGPPVVTAVAGTISSIGDFSGDGIADAAVVAGGDPTHLQVYKGSAAGTMTFFSTLTPLAQMPFVVGGSAVAELTGDTLADIVVTTTTTATVFPGDGAGGLLAGIGTDFGPVDDARPLSIARLDTAGALDLMQPADEDMQLLRTNGASGFLAPTMWVGNAGPIADYTPADLDADGRSDMVVVGDAGTFSVKNDGDGDTDYAQCNGGMDGPSALASRRAVPVGVSPRSRSWRTHFRSARS